MPRTSNLASMSVDALLKLKDDVASMLSRKTDELKKQLTRLEGRALGSFSSAARPGRKPHPRKGKKVPPKYRDSKGNTWAGRGAQPVWLRDALKGGAKLEDFTIAPGAKRGRKPRKAA